MKFVREFVTRPTPSGTFRASALNHELRYDPVKSQPIVKSSLFFFPRLLVRKFFRSFRQPDKILDRLRRFFLEQTNHNIALRSFKNCVSSRIPAHQFSSPKYVFIVHDPSSHAPPALIMHSASLGCAPYQPFRFRNSVMCATWCR